MSNLAHRQSKIQEKRKQTPWREFVMEICSWMPIGLQKNQGMVSRYPETRMKNIVSNKEFNERRDTLVVKEKPEQSDENFATAFDALRKKTPFSCNIQQGKNENTDYADSILNSRNVYLSFGIFEACSDIYYSVLVTNNCTNIYNSIQITNNCDIVYYSTAIDKSSYIMYCKYILNSHHLYFCTNMIGCNDCILCDGLDNKSYCINNKQLTKEEYLTHKDEILNQKGVYNKYPNHTIKSKNYNSTNVDGDCVLFSQNIENARFVTRANTGRNLVFVTGEDKDGDIYDCCDCGINGTNFYGVQGGGTNANNYYCIGQSESCFDIYYSYYLYNCSFCFGCIGLKNASYCIYNTQYTKEERYSKVDEIFAQMDADGTLGKFFPATMNPFYFNDTAAYLIDPSFTQEEVTAAGYLRRDEPIKVDIPADAQIVQSKDLGSFESLDAEGNRLINADILKKVIQDDLGNYYRIIPMEYKFLMKHALPLPRKHRLERMKENFRIG